MRTKIVATVGPASGSPECVRELIQAGVSVFRLNFSHGTHAEHAAALKRIREAAQHLGANVCILQDLQGPKIRTGALKGGGPVLLDTGCRTSITTQPVPGDADCFSTSYQALAKDVHTGDRILIDDGLIELRVVSTADDTVFCEVVDGGELREHKGVNLPGVEIGVPPLTEKDIRDVEFGIELGVDAVALSFVRRSSDIDALRQVLREHGCDAPVVAKVEKPEAVRNIGAVLKAADGVMIARGDLGVEMSPEEVPVLQKQIILEANRLAKPVITATQMLESMIHEPRPTRAEASDVANAVLDSTDAVMLSGETAIGRYPVQATKMMARIIDAAERAFRPHPGIRPAADASPSTAAAVADAGVQIAEELRARAIVVFTMSGATAKLLAQRRPACPIHAFSPRPETCRRLAMVWGVAAHMLPLADATDALVVEAERELNRIHELKQGDKLVFVSGTTPLPGATNAIKVVKVE